MRPGRFFAYAMGGLVVLSVGASVIEDQFDPELSCPAGMELTEEYLFCTDAEGTIWSLRDALYSSTMCPLDMKTSKIESGCNSGEQSRPGIPFTDDQQEAVRDWVREHER